MTSHQRLRQWLIALRDRELPLRTVSSRSAQTGIDFTPAIPNVVHQAWQDHKVGRNHKRVIETFRDRNPDFHFILYTNDDQYDYMSSHYAGEQIFKIFVGALNGVMRADIFRYCVMYREGGIYLDFSKQLHAPLRDFITLQSRFVLSHERNPIPDDLGIKVAPIHPLSSNLFVQWCLMSAPGHRFLSRMIDNICIHAPEYDGVRLASPKDALLRLTSSYMWTRSVWDELIRNAETEDYVLVEPDYNEPLFPLIPESYARYLMRGQYSTHKNQVILIMPDIPMD